MRDRSRPNRRSQPPGRSSRLRESRPSPPSFVSRPPEPGTRAPDPGWAGGDDSWVVGFHAVVAALDAEPARIEVVVIGEGVGGPRAREVLERARAAGVRYRNAPRRQLDEVAHGVAHNGFAARLAPRRLADADALLDLPSPVCVLGLDGVEDGHNLGAVIRVAAGFEIGGVVVAGPHPPPLGGAAAKVAAGTMHMVEVAHVGSLGDFAMRAKASGFWVVGADVSGTPVTACELPDRLLLCLGGEAGGLRAKTRRAVDEVVSIPLAPAVDSLNLSVAAAVLSWEWRRRFPIGGARAEKRRQRDGGGSRRSVRGPSTGA